jgi:hypothetical protein
MIGARARPGQGAASETPSLHDPRGPAACKPLRRSSGITAPKRSYLEQVAWRPGSASGAAPFRQGLLRRPGRRSGRAGPSSYRTKDLLHWPHGRITVQRSILCCAPLPLRAEIRNAREDRQCAKVGVVRRAPRRPPGRWRRTAAAGTRCPHHDDDQPDREQDEQMAAGHPEDVPEQDVGRCGAKRW